MRGIPDKGVFFGSFSDESDGGRVFGGTPNVMSGCLDSGFGLLEWVLRNGQTLVFGLKHSGASRSGSEERLSIRLSE